MARNKQLSAEINKMAEEVIAVMKKHGVVVQRYNSYTTNSVYLKFDYGVCNSLRISDHKGKKHLAYRYNLLHGVKKPYTTKTRNGWDMHYYPLNHAHNIAWKILNDRQKKIENYGHAIYQHYMLQNKLNNQNSKGFWQQAVLV